MITEMIAGFLLTSVEIYVLAAVAAAGVIALFVRPSRRGEARQYLLAGTLCAVDDGIGREPSLRIECLAGGDVLLTRCGLPPVGVDGAVSLAVTVIGFDIEIEERIVDGSAMAQPVDMALFTLDFLGRDRYHVRYNSQPTAMAASFTLSNREGMSLVKTLTVSS